jgi:hypothetical protein
MANHKVLSAEDSKDFVKTASFYVLCKKLEGLKTSKGRFIHVLGTPGTGKSANIYQAISMLDITVYDAFLFINADSKPYEVYKIFWDTLKKDMDVKSKKEVFKKASEFDLVLFADPFLDSEYIDKHKVGLGLWTENNGPSTFPFYFRIFYEYIKNYNDLKDVNVVTQTSWVLKFRGVRYDILTDFHLLSRALVFILNLFFDVVVISYTKEEMIKIVKTNYDYLSDEEIEDYIKKYGNRPRFIFKALEKDFSDE